MKKTLLLSLLILTTRAYASGMVPETSVLLVDEQKGEVSMNLTNSDPHPSLLYTKVVDLADSDKSIRLIVTQLGSTRRARGHAKDPLYIANV